MDKSGGRGGHRARRSENAGPFLARSLRSFQENVERSGPVAGASYALIGGILLFGGIGYALDSWLTTSHWFLLGGLFLGIIVGFYGLAKTVWH